MQRCQIYAIKQSLLTRLILIKSNYRHEEDLLKKKEKAVLEWCFPPILLLSPIIDSSQSFFHFLSQKLKDKLLEVTLMNKAECQLDLWSV